MQQIETEWADPGSDITTYAVFKSGGLFSTQHLGG
jgi:hypothetical protein